MVTTYSRYPIKSSAHMEGTGGALGKESGMHVTSCMHVNAGGRMFPWQSTLLADSATGDGLPDPVHVVDLT